MSILHDGERAAQRRFGVAEEGEAMSRVIRDRLTPAMARFIAEQPFFFIATANREGDCDCSFRGREHHPPAAPEPALAVLDATTLLFPDCSGNNLYNSLGNILVNPNIGMLFVDFRTGRRARVNGRAAIVEDRDRLRDRWPGALRGVLVSVVQAYPNCRQRVPIFPLPAMTQQEMEARGTTNEAL